MLVQILKLGVVAGAGYTTWKALTKQRRIPFFREALQSGVAEVAAARSAQRRGASAELRAFAQQLEREHGEHNVELAQASGLDQPEPDARQVAALRKVERLQGRDYDRAWLEHVARSHRNAIRLYEREVAQQGPGGPLAEDLLPGLRAHVARVGQLQRAAKAGEAAAELSAQDGGSDGGTAAVYGEPRAVM